MQKNNYENLSYNMLDYNRAKFHCPRIIQSEMNPPPAILQSQKPGLISQNCLTPFRLGLLFLLDSGGSTLYPLYNF